MKYVEVDGVRLSAIGVGCWQFGSSDWGYGRDYGGRGEGRMAGMPRYDDMFRGRERHVGPPQGRRGRDAGRMGWRDIAPTPFGPGAHPSRNQFAGPGETDFLGRPYSPRALDEPTARGTP